MESGLGQDSLGGSTKTMMIACLGPASCNYEETLASLRCTMPCTCVRIRTHVHIHSTSRTAVWCHLTHACSAMHATHARTFTMQSHQCLDRLPHVAQTQRHGIRQKRCMCFADAQGMCRCDGVCLRNFLRTLGRGCYSAKHISNLVIPSLLTAH